MSDDQSVYDRLANLETVVGQLGEQLDWMAHKVDEVDGLGKQLYAVLHTINLQSLGDAVRQLQEKYRGMKAQFDGLSNQVSRHE